MKRTLVIPGISPALSSLILHFVIAFLTTFGGSLAANASGATSIPTLMAILGAAASAGLVSVVHIGLGLIPTPTPVGAYGLSLKVKTAGYQLFTSVAVMFFAALGAQLATGAEGATSFPDLIAVIVSAISAAVFAVISYLVGLIPAPKNASNQSGGSWGPTGGSDDPGISVSR